MLLLTAFVALMPSGAVAGEVWTLERALSFAATNSPDTRVSQHRMTAARATLAKIATPALLCALTTAAGLIGVHLQREHDRRFERCRPDQRRHLEVGDLTALADALALPSPGPTG